MKQRKIAPSDHKVFHATAHHEAGHGVIAYRFRHAIREGGIVADPSGDGEVHCKPQVQPYTAGILPVPRRRNLV